MRFIRNWKISVPAAGVVLVGLAWLAFGFFGIHTAFIDDEVAEALPEFDVPGDVLAEDPAASVAEAAPDAELDAADESAPTAPPAGGPDATAPPATDPGDPVIVTEASGAFSGTDRYDVSGDAIVLGNGTGQRFLRFEDFASSNGPDLNVYLFDPDDPNAFVDLGDLKGNVGEQNYEIAADVDLERFSIVTIWCVRFGTGFGSAALVAA